MLPSEHPLQRDQPGYESYLNFRVVSLADLLQDAGIDPTLFPVIIWDSVD